MLSLFSDRQVELELSDEIALVEKCAPFTLPLPLVELVALLPLSEWSDKKNGIYWAFTCTAFA